MNKTIDDYKDLIEYQIAKKVWDDIYNNDHLTFNTFDDYFLHVFYTKTIRNSSYSKILEEYKRESEKEI